MDVLDLLSKNEESIGRLYRVYAEKFQHKDLWLGLAEAELRHANLIRELGPKVTEGSLRIDERRFNRQAIEHYQNYLDGELKKAQQEEISLINALSVALYIEQSLIERRFLDVFQTESVTVKRVLSNIQAETEAHLRRIKKVWSENR